MAAQSKIQNGGGKVRPPSISPSIALFLEAGGGLAEEAIDLSQAEYAALQRAAAPTDSGVLMFMANLALEKIGWPSMAIESKTTQSRQREVRSAKALSAAGIHKGKMLTFHFTDPSGAELAHLSLDERQSSLLERVAAATGLTFEELFCFIMDRQFEGFFPPGDHDVFSIREDATREVDTGLRSADRATTALRAVSEEVADRLQAFREKQALPDGRFLADLPGIFSLIRRLAISADIGTADALMHWTNSVRPALLESRVSTPLTTRPKEAA